jgi:pantetheine-phosphate adenylyltransferase
MKTAIYSGSFDPITKGHQDVIKKALKLVDKLIILIIENSNKKCWFTLEERRRMIELTVGGNPDIEIVSSDGLLVDFMKERGVEVIIRGLRAVADYEYELVYAFFNNELSGGVVDTVFIPASRQFMYLSSSGAREAALAKAKLDIFVDENIINIIKNKVEELLPNKK